MNLRLRHRCRLKVQFAPTLAVLAGIAATYCTSAALTQIPYEITRTFGLAYPGPSDGNLQCGLVAGPDDTLYGTARGPIPVNGNIFRVNRDGTGFRTLHFFGSPGDGRGPLGDMTFGPDAALYGTTGFGGHADLGTVFKIHPDGTGYRISHSFAGFPTDGSTPRGELVLGDDGVFYGVTVGGSAGNRGSIFRIRPDGTGYAVVHHFNGSVGANIRAGLIRDAEGNFYGVAADGGQFASGTIFKLAPNGSNITVLHHFSGVPNGASPVTRLIEASDGWLYGTTSGGGMEDGIIFRVGKDGSGFEVLHRFDPDAGLARGANLIEASDGALYGTTRFSSWLFRIHKDGSNYQRIWALLSITDPGGFHGPLWEGPEGLLYGATQAGGTNRGGTVFSIGKDGVGLHILTHFPSTRSQDQLPRAPLIQASDGFFYGTTEAGGTSSNGLIFLLNASGSDYRILHDFGALPSDGSAPNGLLESRDGLLYGTTQRGGSNSAGVLFRVQKDGSNYMRLYHFGAAGDARNPSSTLLEGSDGMLYGTSSLGGSANRGCVFRLSRAGTDYQIVHTFMGPPADGFAPRGDLLEITNGTIVGITMSGGVSNRGAIFSMNKDGSAFTVVRSFEGGSMDGAAPQGGLLAGSDGRLYGTTTGGGSANGGVVFSVRADGGDYRVLHSLGGTDGAVPRSRLVEGPEGFLYGTTFQGGTFGRGTVFAINHDGTGYRVLWHFGALSDGAGPVAGVILGRDGALHGVTEGGGSMLLGTAYRLDPRDVVLSIHRDGGQARVTWPVTSTVDVLEECAGFSDQWTAVSPISSDGTAYEASVSLSTASSSLLRVARSWSR